MKLTDTCKIVLLAIFCTPWLSLEAQNFVPNSGFEDTVQCPYQVSQIFFSTGWYSPTNASPDYFNSCNDSSVGIPNNFAGKEFARTGEAYVGIYTYTKGAQYREYIQAQLVDTLTPGVKYNISFYVSLADSSEYACGAIGAYLSQTPVSSGALILLSTPQISNSSANPLTSKSGWILVADTMTATGGELYITIGNFDNLTTSDTMFVGGNLNSHAYYYIDDISVQLDHSAAISDNKSEDSSDIYPNPGNGIFKVEWQRANSNDLSVQVYNIYGENVYSSFISSTKSEIDLRNQTNGIYFLRIKSDIGVSTQKIIIQK